MRTSKNKENEVIDLTGGGGTFVSSQGQSSNNNFSFKGGEKEKLFQEWRRESSDGIKEAKEKTEAAGLTNIDSLFCAFGNRGFGFVCALMSVGNL